MLKLNKGLLLFLSLIFVLSSKQIYAKNQNGDFFMTLPKSTFPRIGIAKLMNSLQVSANPLIEDPFSEKERLSTFEDYKKISAVFPNMELVKTSIIDLDLAKLRSATAEIETWSNHAMPTNRGGIAFRYADELYQKNKNDWSSLFEAYKQNPPSEKIRLGFLDSLSPIEKYEYLIGNTSFSMTENQWEIGKELFERLKEIPEWAGMCHGTTPASMRYNRPQKSVVLKSYDNQKEIEFNPSDIKELLSYAWAIDGGPSEILGQRCYTPLIGSGRPEGNCLDPNPASFHLAVIQLLGIGRWPFILDTSAGIEVWKHTEISYSIEYFRPGSNALTQNIQSALIKYADYKNRDPFKFFRSKEINSIVGINLTLTLISTTLPSILKTNSTSEDQNEKVTYNYDLELDSNLNIIGGQWKNNNHPDFLWVIARDYFPQTIEDRSLQSRLSNYDGITPLDQYSLDLARSAAKKNKILFTLLEAMIKLSNEK